jgi:hypothetical protein
MSAVDLCRDCRLIPRLEVAIHERLNECGLPYSAVPTEDKVEEQRGGQHI